MPRNYNIPRRSGDSPIAAARVNKGLTQAQIAEILGVGTNTYVNWENGTRDIPATSFVEICKLLEIDYDEIYEWQTSAQKTPIESIRKSKGMKQIDLARALGISQPLLSAYEAGRCIPPIVVLEKMAEVLEVPIDKLNNRKTKSDIATIRKWRGMTQSELANAIGSSLRTVAYYESDPGSAPAEMLDRIAEALNVPVETIRQEKKKPTLAVIRAEKGMSQSKLAKMIGITQSTLSYYENRAAYIPSDLLAKIAEALNVSVDDLKDKQGE